MPTPVTVLSPNTASNLVDRELANAFVKLANFDTAGIVCAPERSSGNTARERAGAASALVTPAGLGATLQRAIWNNKIVTTVANTAAETTLLDATGNGNLSVPAVNLVAGAVYELQVYGILSTFTSGTLVFKLKGGAAGATVLLTNTAITPQASQTNVYWSLQAFLQVLTAGASGFVIGAGLASIESATRSAASFSTGVAGAAVDLSVQNILDLSVTWSVANAANSISVLNGCISRIR